jgi:lipopolysaccharide exporter
MTSDPPALQGVEETPSGTQENLTARTASGLSWSYLSTAVLLAANLIYTATISRLLEPAAFGLLATANLVILFTLYFARMGIASAVVQKPELSKEDIRAASTAGVVIGLVCMAVVWALAWPIAAVFRNPDLPPILRALSVSFVFTGWSMTGLGLLRRELRFKAMSLIAIGAYVSGYVVIGVGLALLGAGVWSLVAAVVSSTAIQAVSQYAVLRHPVRPPLRWQPYRAVVSYGARLQGAYLMDYVGGNLDTFTVTRFASTAVVGQYSRAYYLVFQPLGNYLTQALTNVLFSALSRIQQDLARLRRAYLTVMMLAAVAVFPMSAGMAVAATQLTLVVLGPQWDLVVGLVPWFALAGACHVVSQMSQLMAEARAELNRSMAVQASYLLVLGILLIVAVRFRTHGVWVIAAAVAVSELARYVGYLALARRVLGLSLAEIARAHVPAAFASAGVALAVGATALTLADSAPALVVLGAEIAAGAAALGVCIRCCPTPAVRTELWSRLGAAGLIGTTGGVRERMLRLVLGTPHVPVGVHR